MAEGLIVPPDVADQQAALWKKNLACSAAPFAWFNSVNNVKVDTTTCDSGDVLVRALIFRRTGPFSMGRARRRHQVRRREEEWRPDPVSQRCDAVADVGQVVKPRITGVRLARSRGRRCSARSSSTLAISCGVSQPRKAVSTRLSTPSTVRSSREPQSPATRNAERIAMMLRQSLAVAISLALAATGAATQAKPGKPPPAAAPPPASPSSETAPAHYPPGSYAPNAVNPPAGGPPAYTPAQPITASEYVKGLTADQKQCRATWKCPIDARVSVTLSLTKHVRLS